MSYYDYSTTASSNSTIAGINIAEGCQAGNLNDAIRASMADTAAYLSDVGGALDTAGSANTYTVTTSQTLTLADGLHLWVRINVTNTGASTINVDGTGARSIKRFSGGSAADVAAGDLAAGSLLFLSYDSANGYFLASGFMPATLTLTGDIQFTTGGNTATAGHIDYPDVSSADVDLFVFGASTNTSGTVEFTICGGSGSDTDKKHSFFDNSALISRGGGSTGFGRTSGGTYIVDVYNATADYLARFESGDANAYILFQDSASTSATHVGIGAEGNELHLRAGDIDMAFLTDAGLRINGTGGALQNAFVVRDRNDSNASECIIRGDGDVENTNNSYGGISDKRLKQDIRDYGDALPDIMAMQLKKYRLKRLVAKHGKDAPEHLGLIAQDLVEAGQGGLVSEDAEGMLSVKYSTINLKLLRAVQQLVGRVEALEAKLSGAKQSVD